MLHVVHRMVYASYNSVFAHLFFIMNTHTLSTTINSGNVTLASDTYIDMRRLLLIFITSYVNSKMFVTEYIHK